MYGDTHVEPDALFDPNREAPPADAIDVYFNTPLSLSLLGDAYAHQGMQRELDILLGFYAGLAGEMVTALQRQGGYVEAVRPGRPAVPARLRMAAIAHNTVPGISTMRLHLHVYVGNTATALDDGRTATVDRRRLGRGINSAWGRYLTAIEQRTPETLGVRWGPAPGTYGTEQEIVDPPLVDHLAGHDLGTCPGDFGPREQLLADADWRRDKQESARVIAHQTRASG